MKRGRERDREREKESEAMKQLSRNRWDKSEEGR